MDKRQIAQDLLLAAEKLAESPGVDFKTLKVYDRDVVAWAMEKLVREGRRDQIKELVFLTLLEAGYNRAARAFDKVNF